MTRLDATICWAVIAPLPPAELERVAAREWNNEAPHAIDPPPWQAVAGQGGYHALISRSPGTEGSDRHFAAILSRLAPDRPVYALWLDPERRQAVEWKGGSETGTPLASVDEVAALAGFSIAPEIRPFPVDLSLAVVEGASLPEVRGALGEFADASWLRVEEGTAGVVLRATDGPLGTQAWDVAAALPSATVYFVQEVGGAFEVLVLRGQEEAGQYRMPALDGEPVSLENIKGETAPDAILRALGVST